MPQIRDLLGGAQTKHAGAELSWGPGEVLVKFVNGRVQRVRYEAHGDFLRFSSTVLKPAAARKLDLELLAAELLERNRDTSVIAFGLSPKDHLEAWFDQRAATLQADELRYYLGVLAAEADRLEYLLVGEDDVS